MYIEAYFLKLVKVLKVLEESDLKGYIQISGFGDKHILIIGKTEDLHVHTSIPRFKKQLHESQMHSSRFRQLHDPPIDR